MAKLKAKKSGVTPPKNKKAGLYFFEDWCICDPLDEKLNTAAWKARYAKEHLTQEDLYYLLYAVEAYQHLATHPASNKSILGQLAQVRAAVRKDVKG